MARLSTLSLLMGFLFLFIGEAQGQKNKGNEYPHVAKYYHLVQKAELAICEGRHKKANRLYQKAFKQHRPFMTDNYNACLSALHAGDEERFRAYFNALVGQGIKKKDLERIVSYGGEHFPKLLGSVPGLLENYTEEEHGNKQFIREIISIRNDDQSVRHWCLDATGDMYHESCLDSIEYVDSVNYHRVIAVYEKYNYPLEVNGISPYHQLAGEIIIGHNISSNRYWMDSLCIAKVRDGTIYARKAAHLLTRKGINPPESRVNYFFSPLIINGDLYIPKISPDKTRLKELDRMRLNLYLCNMDDFRRKMIFQFNNSIFCFMPDSYIGRMDGVPNHFIEETILPCHTKWEEEEK